MNVVIITSAADLFSVLCKSTGIPRPSSFTVTEPSSLSNHRYFYSIQPMLHLQHYLQLHISFDVVRYHHLYHQYTSRSFLNCFKILLVLLYFQMYMPFYSIIFSYSYELSSWFLHKFSLIYSMYILGAVSTIFPLE